MYNAEVYDNVTEGAYKIAVNFAVKEFACKDGSRMVIIHPALAKYLQMARDHFGKPLIINSGFRTATHNAKVGGASNSQHLYGTAADVYIPGVSVLDLYNYFCSIAGETCGIGIYDNFVHFDVRPVKARFDYRSK